LFFFVVGSGAVVGTVSLMEVAAFLFSHELTKINTAVIIKNRCFNCPVCYASPNLWFLL
jgi:hypothetical protein